MKSKVRTNFIYDSIYQVLILIIPFVTTPYIARTIGAKGIGIYSYTYSIVNYFMMFALLGMNNYGNREVSKVKNNKEKLNKKFSSIYYLQLIVTIGVSLIYLVYIYLKNSIYFKIELIQGIYLISVAFDINWLFCGLQEFKMTVTRSGIIKIITLILIFLFIRNENDLWKYIMILAITTFLNQLVLWPFIKGKVKFVKVKSKDIFKHLKPTLILFIPVIAISIFKVMDKIMIGNISSVTEVGYYENAEKMLNIILSVVGALGTVTLPEMTYLYANKKFDQYNDILNKSIIFILLIVFPTVFGFIITADNLVYFYLGDSFQKTALLLKILSISLLFSPIANIVRMQLLIPQGKDKAYIISVISGALVNLILNLILIKKINSIGASIATVTSEFMVFIIQILFVKKDFKFKFFIKPFIRFLSSSLLMFLILYIISKFISNSLILLIIQIVLGILTYIALNYKYFIKLISLKC